MAFIVLLHVLYVCVLAVYLPFIVSLRVVIFLLFATSLLTQHVKKPELN